MIQEEPVLETFFPEEQLTEQDGLLNEQDMQANNTLLQQEYEWLERLIRQRFSEYSEEWSSFCVLEEITPRQGMGGKGPFEDLNCTLNLDLAERVLLLLALEPHYRPQLISGIISDTAGDNNSFYTTLGFFADSHTGAHYPTLQTFLILCAGKNPAGWRKYEQEVLHRGRLIKEQIILLRDPDDRSFIGNRIHFLLDIAPEYVDYLLHGRAPRPDFGRGFPAKLVTTNLSWDQLVLNKLTLSEIEDVMDWVSQRKNVIKRSEGKINHSFPCLFYGPPGTGKSFTAKLIGKRFGKDVFRIDLSMIVSKYIGETEKNLASLFDRAEGKDWILFFDEADSLFGKRTGISDSKDKWANLEMSYLLQRVEEYDGLCILATNLRHNLDVALMRRFQATIFFPFPKPEERAQIWKKALPPGFEYFERVSYEKLGKYELSGASITNVIKASCVKASKRGDNILAIEDVIRFIKIEYAKDSRTIN